MANGKLPRSLQDRARFESGSSPPTPTEPREEFRDVHYLLERSLHLSLFDVAGSYEARTLNLKRFMSLGLAMLPKKEELFRKEMLKWMEENLDAPKVETRPAGGGDESPKYEILTNLRGGSSDEVYREHLEFAVHSVRETFYEEQYNILMVWADKLVMKLVEYEILPDLEAYHSGQIGQQLKPRRRAGRASVMRRAMFEKDEDEDSEEA